MLYNLISYFLPEIYNSEDLEKSEYAKKNRIFFVMFAFVSIATTLLFSGIFLYLENYIAATVNLVIPLVMIGILFAYKFTDLYKPMVFLYSLCNFIIIGTAHATSPVSVGSNMVWYPLILIVAYVMLHDKKYSWAVTTFGLFAFSGAEFISSQGIFHDEQILLGSLQVTAFNIISLIAATIVAHIVGQIIVNGEMKVIDSLVERGKEVLLAKEQAASLLSVVSHDIANPLQLVDTYLMRLKTDAGNGVAADQIIIEKMQKSVNQISMIIKSSQELRAMELGKANITLRPTSLKQALNEMQNSLKIKLEEKEITLQYYWPNDLQDILVDADLFSLTNNVLMNIFSNAIKFSFKGEDIDVRIRLKNDEVTLEIRDYGIGIPKDLIPYVFSQNHSTSRLGTDGEKGTGFGLPIVKMFMQLYGGKIQVKSESSASVSSLKRGTLFILNFKKSQATEKEDSMAA